MLHICCKAGWTKLYFYFRVLGCFLEVCILVFVYNSCFLVHCHICLYLLKMLMLEELSDRLQLIDFGICLISEGRWFIKKRTIHPSTYTVLQTPLSLIHSHKIIRKYNLHINTHIELYTILLMVFSNFFDIFHSLPDDCRL